MLSPTPLARLHAAATAALCAIAVAAALPTTAHAAPLDEIETLLRDGRVVEARQRLVELRRDTDDRDERLRAEDLLAATERRLAFMDRAEISIQHAELALAEGDVRSAELHASGVRRLDTATREQRDEADALLQRAASLRAELEPLVQPAIKQAVADFQDQRFAESKAGFASVLRSGVRLTRDQLATVNDYQQRILELEGEQGQPFELTYVPLGVLRAAADNTEPLRPQPRTEQTDGRPELAASDEPAPQTNPEPAQAEQDDTPLIDRYAMERPELLAAQNQTEANRPRDPFENQAQAQDQDPNQDQAEQTADEPADADDPFQEAARFDAQRLLGEAAIAFENAEYAEAARLYQLLTETYARYLSDDQLALAEDRLLEARAQIGREGVGLLPEDIQTRDVMRQQFEAEYANFIERAEAALSEAVDPVEARSLLAQARLRLNTAYQNNLITQPEYEANLAELNDLERRVVNLEEQLRRAEIEQQAEQIEEEAAQQAQVQEEERERKINDALNRLRELQLEQKYEEALQVADQVLFLDPENAAALLMKDLLRDIVLYREFEAIQRRKTLSYGDESNIMQEALVIPERIVDFPPDWPELSFRRGEQRSFVESEEDRRVLATLESTRIPAAFTDNALEDVLAFVGTVTNLNIDVDWESLEDVGIERDTEVTLQLREVPARIVLDRVLEKVSPDDFSRADWAVTDGILLVASDQALRENTFIVIYDIRDLLFEVPNFRDVPALDLDTILQQGGQGGGGGGGSIFGDDDPAAGEQLTEAELLERLLEIVQTNVDFEGWRENGGDTGIIQPYGGNLIITNTAKNHREIQGLLNQLREIRAIQINVEARFLTVSQDFFEQIGFDIDVYFNAQNNQFDDAVAQLEAFGAGTLAGEGLSLLPSEVVGTQGGIGSAEGFVITGFDPDTGQITYDLSPGDGTVAGDYVTTAPDPLSIIPVQSGSDVLTQALQTGAFATEVLAAGGPALAVAGTFLDDIQVDFLVEATQADRRNVSLNAPRLTFVNGKAANIYVVTQEAFVSDLTPVVGTGSVAFDPEVQSLQSGFTLAVQGVASADRRYVTLTVQTGISNVIGFGTGIVNAQAAGGGDEGTQATVSGEFQLPLLAVTQVNTGATVPDKGTLLLGGQRLVTEVEVETGVPVLSKLPIINRFFTNRSEQREEQTLLILVKPTIIIQSEEEERAYPGLLDQLSDPFR